MAPTALEREDIARDAAFNQALHGKSAKARGGFSAMRGKDAAAQKAAVDEYFKHWDNKGHVEETDADREVRSIANAIEYHGLTHLDNRLGEPNMLP